MSAPAKRLITADEYATALDKLSDASVRKHFDPYLDIPWDAPVVLDDPRWILGPNDLIGGHPWYQAQPRDKQQAIGRWRYANLAKVGLQFEQLLIAGFMHYLQKVPNGSPEFRYATHEVIEECNHTLMFQEGVNRLCPEVGGGPKLFRRLVPIIPMFGTIAPEVFFVGVLAGEEPIDHLQKSLLRSGTELHPIIERIFSIHVAEEARHISFAHQYLRKNVPDLNTAQRFSLALAFPAIMKLLCDAIMIPAGGFWRRFEIPDQVRKDIFWQQPRSQQVRQEFFADVRTLTNEIGLMNPASERVWKAMGIHGDLSRYRSEPSREPA